MSKIFLEAAEAIERELVRVEGLAKVAAAFRAAGSLEQMAQELNQRVATAKAAEAEANINIEYAQNKAEKIVANAKAEAIATAERADAQLAIKVSEAKKAEFKAASIMAKANDDGAMIVAEAQAAANKLLETAQAEYDALAPAIEVGKVELELVNTKVAAAQSRLDIITAQLDELRAKF